MSRQSSRSQKFHDAWERDPSPERDCGEGEGWGEGERLGLKPRVEGRRLR
jgi:hypothetical protein